LVEAGGAGAFLSRESSEIGIYLGISRRCLGTEILRDRETRA
jgi:hypothetical protein